MSQKHLLPKIIDLATLDFEALKKKFDVGRKRTEVERLKALLDVKLRRMVRLFKEAYDQGTLLTHSDVAFLLHV